MEIGKWTGPINSGLGVHLVFIKDKKVGGLYNYEEVKDKVIVDYNFEASNDFKKELIISLLKNYTFDIKLDDKELQKEIYEMF